MSQKKRKLPKSPRNIRDTEYDEIAPLFPDSLRAAPGDLNDAEELRVRAPHRSLWQLQYAVIGFLNLLFFGIGCGGAAFALYFAEFFSRLWLSLFVVVLVMCALLVMFGGFGVFAVCWDKVAPAPLYAAIAILVIGSIVAAETLYFITWNNFRSEDNRYTLSRSMGERWAANVNNGGQDQADMCSLESMLGCSGWAFVCNSSASLDDMLSTTLSNYHDSVEEWASNATMGGNCPLCFGNSAHRSTTCADAISNAISNAVWYVLGGGFAIGAAVVANVIWASKSKQSRVRERVSVALLDAQRYL